MSSGDHTKVVYGPVLSWLWESRRTLLWWCASVPLLLLYTEGGSLFYDSNLFALSGFFICLALSCDRKR